MKLTFRSCVFLLAGCLMPTVANAQLSTNPDKFLGNITTAWQINTDGIEFASLWNQITGENESKWSTIEGSRNNFNWGGSDGCYNYAKSHNFPFKFHCLIWGSQYPGWLDNLNASNQYKEIVEWMDAIQARYPDLPMIDVVNEAIPGHAPAPYKNALGGDGVTGYDWIVKAFEMAHERWPNAILIYNDYNTFQWQRNEFINLVRILRDAGAPIDAYGCQSHDLTDMDFSSFKTAMTQIQNALKMPMYSTEYDIGTTDDQKQLQQYKNQIKYMWEQPYVAGITLWGFIYGKTWVTDGNSGIIRNGQDRPAMTWLREYMASDEAKVTPSPFPGFKKPYSIYVRPGSYVAELNKVCPITVDATMHNGETIDYVELYMDNALYATMTEAPYVTEYTPVEKKSHTLKAIVYCTNGNKYERLGGFKTCSERKPFHDEPLTLPGTIEAEDFDMGGEGMSFHDSDNVDEGKSGYRTDNEGVDIGLGGSGYVLGYTAIGEWVEYTVEIEKGGKYYFEAIASSGLDGSAFSMSLTKDGSTQEIVPRTEVPNLGTWDTYQSIKGSFARRINAGTYRLRLNIEGSYLNMDKIIFTNGSNGIADITSADGSLYDIYSTTGMLVGQLDIEECEDVNQGVYNVTGQQGVYLLRSVTTGQTVKVVAHP